MGNTENGEDGGISELKGTDLVMDGRYFEFSNVYNWKDDNY